ncbi:hypothetical protein [Actinomadura sp. 3N508]|uniref:hypothetical protein n=1 Tax=Actinomadura sp. 3N508 TaxID=3375153 RepID=UPI0037AC91A8
MTGIFRRATSGRGTAAALALALAVPTSAFPAAASATSRSAPASFIQTAGGGTTIRCLTGLEVHRVEVLPCLPVFGASRLWERLGTILFNQGQKGCLFREYHPPTGSTGVLLGCPAQPDLSRVSWFLTSDGRIHTERPAEDGTIRCLTHFPDTSMVYALPCQTDHPQQKWRWRF